MKDGIINLNKPAGVTSNDMIYKVRSILGVKKVGHTGTLDPLATGVLPICINKGTRVAEYLDVDFKTYCCTMILGIVTDTQDVTGNVLEDNLVSVKESDVKKAFKGFHGLIDQMPPMYSAVRIEGRKLYDVMHNGTKEEQDEIEKKVRARQVYIKKITVDDPLYVDGDSKYSNKPHVRFTVECSKGTYIRTICQNVGEILGCGATMESLVRTASGAFKIEDAVELDELIEAAKSNGLVKEEISPKGYNRLVHTTPLSEDIPEALEKYVLPLDYPLEKFGKAIVNKEVAQRFIDGWHISYREIKITKKPTYKEPVPKEELRDADPESKGNHNGSYAGLKVYPEFKGAYRLYQDDGTFLGVAFHNDRYHKLVADKVLVR